MDLAFATVKEIAERAADPIITDAEKALARRLLSLATNRAKLHGSMAWNPLNVPPVVRDIVIEAAARGYNNPEGFVEERGDMVSLNRDAAAAAGVEFTARELADIRLAANRGSGFASVSLYRDEKPWRR